MSISRQQKRRQEKLAKKAAKKNNKLSSETLSNGIVEYLLSNHNKEYIDNKISTFFPKLVKNNFLDFPSLLFSAKHNVLGINNIKDMATRLKEEQASWILVNQTIADYLDKGLYVEEIVKKLNATTDQIITSQNAKDYALDLINRIPEVFRYALENDLDWSSEKEIENLNKQFAKAKKIEYKRTGIYSEDDIKYFKEVYENLSYKYLETANYFKRKYITSDYRLLIDNFYDHPEDWWYNEGKKISEDIADFVTAWYFAEKDSTDLKYLVYHSEHQIAIFHLCHKELGINIHEFVDKSEYELKHRVRNTIQSLNYGMLSQLIQKKKYKNKDPNVLIYMNVPQVEIQYTKESFRKMLLEPEMLSDLIEALKLDISKLQKKENKVTFEEIVRSEINSLIVSKINMLSNKFYDLQNFYREEDFDKLISGISFENEITEIIESLSREENYSSYFEYPDFENRLRSTILELLNDSKSVVEDQALQYKKKIIDNDPEEILNRVETYLENKLNFIHINKDSILPGYTKNKMIEIFGSNFKELSLIDQYKIIFDNAKEFLDKIEINQEDKKTITDRIDFLFEHNKKYFEDYKDPLEHLF